MKKRNRGSFLIIVLLLIMSLASLGETVTAHSPEDMDIVYDENSSTLTVIITHKVDNRTTHYINGVKICVQESIVKTINYTSQPTEDNFHYQYNIVAVKGDKIKVAAYCNNGGEIHEDLVVGSVQSSLNIPGFAKLYLIFILSVALFVIVTARMIKKRK
ncbi:MAG: hypothetical protein EU530_04060 [Promethearchaeota archaeon]|nr:MAG: hypothetical protein EU530_04060 [Candidatus Lokiarchaeota archaeon]